MENINYWNKEQKERIIKLLKIVFEESNEEDRNNKSDSIRTSNREDSLQD